MQRADVLVRQPIAAANEDFPQWGVRRGHDGLPKTLFGGLRGLPVPAFFGVSRGGLAYPCAFVMRLAPRRQPVAVARAVARQHLLEFVPVDGAVLPMPRLVLLHAGVGDR